jgi:hypothetical protein
MLKALFCFDNLHVFLVLSENLEEAVEHLTMEIMLNLSSAIVCSCCYLGSVDNGVAGQMDCNPGTSSCRFPQVIPQPPSHWAVACCFSCRVSALGPAIEPLLF